MRVSYLVIAATALCTAIFAGTAIQVRGAAPQGKATGEAAKGQAVFNDRCAICHYDQSTAQKLGPGLKGIYARGKYANGKKVDDASMTVWIQKGGEDMPPMKDDLKPEEIRVLLVYLKTL